MRTITLSNVAHEPPFTAGNTTVAGTAAAAGTLGCLAALALSSCALKQFPPHAAGVAARTIVGGWPLENFSWGCQVSRRNGRASRSPARLQSRASLAFQCWRRARATRTSRG